MADYNLTKSWSSIDTITDNADAGNIGKDSPTKYGGDTLLLVKSGFYSLGTSATNTPLDGATAHLVVNAHDSNDILQIWTQRIGDVMKFRRIQDGVASAWREIYHDNGNGVTAAEAATAIKGAKDGNIGVAHTESLLDVQGINTASFHRASNGTPNLPSQLAASYNIINGATSSATNTTIAMPWLSTNPRAFIRCQNGTYSPWQELYHTGNVGAALFGSPLATPSGGGVAIGDAGTYWQSNTGTTGLKTHQSFSNPNGVVGSISTSGTSAQFNTSSDNRLKDPIGKPSDADIDAKFKDIYDTFTLFNWRNDPDGDAVWGFLAHDVIDKGLDFGSEGEGPRNLNIGDVYETIPAETEQRPIMETITDDDGNEIEQQATDEQGNLLFEEVVVKEAIEKRVTPAGVDQSKVVPYLVAKIERQDRLIADLIQRLDAAGL